MADRPMTYGGSGVNYGAMDPAKVNAQELGRATAHYVERFGYREVPESRGESVYLLEGDDHYLAFVIEGLGTKNLVADVMWHVLGKHFDAKYARDALAMILGDLNTAGALPMVVGQYLAVGSDRWFSNPGRSGSLALGWTEGCEEARAVYACGETPTLRDIILPTAADLAGASLGIIKPKDRRIDPANLRDGDDIVFLASSGVHANGLTLLRDIGDKVGYSARLSDGRMFGEAALDPTPIYSPVIEAVLDAGVRPHYAVNITGHGWRKLMRHTEPFVYRVSQIPRPQPIFGFIADNGPVEPREMYANYNMGAGYALYTDPSESDAAVAAAKSAGCEAWIGGKVEKDGVRKAVVIEPLDMTFEGDTLQVR